MARHFFVLLALLSCACEQDRSAPRGANGATRIVLITVDTLRHDSFFSPDGGSDMPELQRFARSGLVFTSCYASTSTTQPTHASLFTGRHPWEHGVTRNGIVLAEGATTVAEHLSTLGFSTSAVVASFPLHAMFGYDQGFDRYVDDFTEPYVPAWEGQLTEGGAFFSLASDVTQKAIAAVDDAEGRRQFFWFHYFDPHDPYGDAGRDPRRFVGIHELLQAAGARAPDLDARLEAARDSYDRDVSFVDRHLARLLQRLSQDEDRFATHVLITADHGESFGERGALGHGKRVTREQVLVPLILLSPSVEPGVRTDLVSTVDLPRTLLAVAGVDAGALGGRNLLAERDAPFVLGMRRTFAGPKSEQLTDGTHRALPESWFYMVRQEVLWSGNREIVLEEDDPSHPAAAADATVPRATFAALEGLLEAQETGPEVLDSNVQKRLRALGYTR